jgi:hypothetical protein
MCAHTPDELKFCYSLDISLSLLSDRENGVQSSEHVASHFFLLWGQGCYQRFHSSSLKVRHFEEIVQQDIGVD